jgi:hypothetical protein
MSKNCKISKKYIYQKMSDLRRPVSLSEEELGEVVPTSSNDFFPIFNCFCFCFFGSKLFQTMLLILALRSLRIFSL